MKATNSFLKDLRDENSRVLASYIIILFESLIPAVTMMFIWYFLNNFGLIGTNQNQDLIHKAYLALFGVWVYLVKIADDRADDQNIKISSFIESNRDKFNRYHDFKMESLNLDKSDIEGFPSEEKEELENLRKEYIGLRNGRISRRSHLRIGSVCFVWLIVLITIKYDSVIMGMTYIFGHVYAMYFAFKSAVSAENPVEGRHRTKKVPMEWFDDEEIQ